jgi:hypothetical protein
MDLEPRKIIYVAEDEIIFHDRAFRKQIDDKSDEPIISQPHPIGPVSHVISLFERYKLAFDDLDRFSSSVASFLNVNSERSFFSHDVHPPKFFSDFESC